VIQNEHDDRSNDCDQKTPGVKAGYTYTTYRVANEPAHEGPDNAKYDVKHDTLALCD
jgi:hypothetical protein